MALAPWVLPSRRPLGLEGQRLLIVHGDRGPDRQPQRSAALAERLRRRGHPVDYVTVQGGKHAMLRHHGEFAGTAARFAVETLRADVTA